MLNIDTIILLTKIFDCISICIGIFIIIIIILIRIYYPVLAKSITLRLSGWIALSDIMVSVVQIIYIHGNQLFPNMSTLTLGFILTSLQTSSLFFIYLTVCVAINLHMTILTSKYRNIVEKIDPWMVPISFLWAFITTIPFHIWFEAEWNIEINGFIKKPTWAASYYMWASQYIWQLLGEIYCMIIITLVIIKLFQIKRYKKEQISYQTNSTIDYVNTNKRLTFIMLRIVWYPVIPIITQSWLIIMNIYTIPNNILYININNIMSSIQGILNGIVFCFNPIIYILFKEFYFNVRLSKENTIDKEYKFLKHNQLNN